MCVALVLGILATTTATAGEMISLEKVRFYTMGGWADDSKSAPAKGGKANPAWVIGTPTGQPYGDSGVNNFADLSNFTKLVIVASDGTPRIMLNRTKNDGQYNDTEAESFLIEYPKCENGWAGKYFSKVNNEDGTATYTVDLKKIYEDKGFCYLNAIKANGWGSTVTIVSMELEKAPAIGWTSIIDNGDFEWDNFESFPVVTLGDVKEEGVEVQKGTILPIVWASEEDEQTRAYVKSGVGKDDSRGLVLTTMADAPKNYTTQLFVKFDEVPAAGTQWRFSMDVKSDPAATGIGGGIHSEPRTWIGGPVVPSFDSNAEWQTFEAEGTITEEQAQKGFQSIAFDLNQDQVNSTTFYFDNINFEVYKVGTSAIFSDDVILVDFGFETNIPDLVKAAGTPRIIYPADCASVKVNGKAVDLYSIEALADGRFFIFLNDQVKQSAKVEVTFNNPTDENLQLVYASGANKGSVISSFQDVAASYDKTATKNEAFPWDYVKPRIAKADPEDGSFNLPNSISEFKVTFDKETNVKKLKASLNGQALTVTANNAEGNFATEFTLTREGADLANGDYVLAITNAYPKEEGVGEVGEYQITFSIGQLDESGESVTNIIPQEYFANCAAGQIPAGFLVIAGDNQEERIAGTGYGQGPRMFDFAAGGEVTKALYFRDNYVEYGSLEGYALPLEAGKTYEISFNTFQWKGSDYTKFQLLDAEDNALIEKVIANTKNVNGSQAAVTGTAATLEKFVPTATGNYRLRWYPTDKDGNGKYSEQMLGNVAVKYIPNVKGIEYIQALKDAWTAADASLKENTTEDKRYEGVVYSALNDAVTEYDSKWKVYTNPSDFTTAVDVLKQCTTDMGSHHTLCNNYDAAIEKAIKVIQENANNKFAAHDLYVQLQDIVAKYHGSTEEKNVNDDPEGDPIWQTVYVYDKLTDDAALTDAIAELQDIANQTSALFTEGASKVGTTGIAALVDRLRQGAEALDALGVAEDDELMVRINNAITDDDDLAEEVKARITKELYEKLKDENNTVFTDSETGINMTAFVKNPNIYAISPNKGYSAETVPGWDIPEGNGELGNAWAFSYTYDGVAQDVFFTKYRANTRMEQTIYDLPAGVYTIDVNSVRWDNAESEECYAYIMTYDENDEPTTDKVQLKWYSDYNNAHDNLFEGVVITNGKLTLGSKFSSDGQFFFGRVSLKMTSAAEDFDYASAIPTAIETLDGTPAAKVRAIEMFDINGRRVAKAQKGLVIMKQIMSDGSIRTQKVVK